MALTRQQLDPLDGYQERIDWATVLERTNRGLLRWVLGTGFLSFHLAVFTTVLLGTFTWNLISNPTDLHLLSPFRIWGVAALAHTILVGGGLIGWRLFNMGESEVFRPAPSYPARPLMASRSSPSSLRPAGVSQVWTRSVGSAARVNAGARRWAAAATQRPAVAPPPPAANGWPAQPGMTTSPAAPSNEIKPSADVGEATWPESPPISTTLMGATERADTVDHVLAVDHRQSEAAGEDPDRTWVDSFVESRAKDKESRWSWVEAAAASWLNRRDELPSSADKALPATTEPADEPADLPARAEPRDESPTAQ